MIKRKTGICPQCNDGTEKPLIAGLCNYHYWRPKRTAISRSHGVSKFVRTVAPNIRTGPSPALTTAWYESQIKLLSGVCLECGTPYNKYVRDFAFAAVSHILPAKYFPSVALYDDNWLELPGGCGCHTKWEKNWESAAKMKVFPIALEHFIRFETFIAPAERSRIPLIFLDAAR